MENVRTGLLLNTYCTGLVTKSMSFSSTTSVHQVRLPEFRLPEHGRLHGSFPHSAPERLRN